MSVSLKPARIIGRTDLTDDLPIISNESATDTTTHGFAASNGISRELIFYLSFRAPD